MGSEGKRILLVEDDRNFGMVLRDYLCLHDFEVEMAVTGPEGLEQFRRQRFDLCILDVMLPGKDGFSLAADIRELDAETPLVFLTAKSLKEDMLKGFRLGADDYITKPFDADVLLFKIRAILKRNSREARGDSDHRDVFKIGSFRFNYKPRLLSQGEESQLLSPKEADLLRMLCIYMNDVLPREQALNRIWKEDNYFTTRSMDVFVARLRKRLRPDPLVEIVNVHGNGFRLMAIGTE